MPPILRSILAIIVGFLTLNFILGIVTAIITATMHSAGTPRASGNLTFHVMVSLVAATIAGFVAALIAAHKPLQHGIILAAIMLAFGVIAFHRGTSLQPAWYQFMMMVVPPLCVIAGAAIEARNPRRLTL